MTPDDLFAWNTTPEDEAREQAILDALEPPEWFYPFVGRVASETVLLELYVTEVALVLSGGKGPAQDLIKGAGVMRRTHEAARGIDDRFDSLLDEFQPARDGRDAVVHAVLFWQESEGPYADYWEHRHPRSGTLTVLPSDAPAEWMASALVRIEDLLQRVFTLLGDLTTPRGEDPHPDPFA